MNHNTTKSVKALVLDSAVDDHGYSVQTDLTKTYSLRDFKLGTSVSNWKLKIASHEDASSNYERWICNLSFSHGQSHARFHYGPDSDVTHGQWIESGPLSGLADFFNPTGAPEVGWGSLSTSARNRLNVKFLQKLKSSQNTFNGGEFLGEIAETLHGIRHPAEALRTGLREYLFTLKKRCSGIKTRLAFTERRKAINKIVAGTWLEWRFQINTTLQDIHDAGQAYNDLFDDAAGLHPMTKIVASVDDSVVDLGWGERFFRPGNFWHVWSDTNPLRKVSGRMVGLVDVTVLQPVRFDTRLGISPRDWTPTIWNLLPMSFVADYFVNIGDCLSAGGVCTAGLKVLVLTTRTKRRYEASAKMYEPLTRAALNGAGVITDSLSGTESKMVYTTDYWLRTVLNPVDDLWVIPTVSFPTSSTQWINMAALAAQVAETKLAIWPY